MTGSRSIQHFAHLPQQPAAAAGDDARSWRFHRRDLQRHAADDRGGQIGQRAGRGHGAGRRRS